ncbi:water channel [Aureococcus anophagefferens]|nr:water channel [Aureococcus anophagefferens]
MGACSTREISGAHLNPAITATSYALNMPDDSGVSSSKAAAFVFSQVVGATAAAVLNFGMFKNAIRSQEAAAKTAAERGAVWAGAFGVGHDAAALSHRGLFLTEVGTTATLLFLINSINDDDLAFPGKDAGPLFVGGTVALLIVATGTIAGCGMNPARDFGPRLITALASGPKVATAQPAWIYPGPRGRFVGCSAFAFRACSTHVPWTTPRSDADVAAPSVRSFAASPTLSRAAASIARTAVRGGSRARTER